jgi:transposase
MQTITTIGLDIAKSVFQVHGVDAAGEVVIRRQLKRRSVLAFFEARRQAGCQARSVANECAVSWLVPARLQCFTAA